MISWWKCEVWRWVVCHGRGLSSGLDPVVAYIFYKWIIAFCSTITMVLDLLQLDHCSGWRQNQEHTNLCDSCHPQSYMFGVCLLCVVVIALGWLSDINIVLIGSMQVSLFISPITMIWFPSSCQAQIWLLRSIRIWSWGKTIFPFAWEPSDLLLVGAEMSPWGAWQINWDYL